MMKKINKIATKLLIIAVVVACIAWVFSEVALRANEAEAEQNAYIPAEVLVGIKDGDDESELVLIDSVEGRQQYITVEATAYCPCVKCCGKSDGITASGVKAVEGVTIAADTRVFPIGTKIDINGHIYTVQDTGGAIKGNRIDIYFNSHAEALKFGRQTIKVHVIDEMEGA